MTDDPADADPRPLLHRTADQAVRLLTALQPGDLDRPTPCAGFDVRAIGGHVVSVLRGITLVASGAHAPTIPVLTMGAVSVLARTAVVDHDRMAAAWADDRVLDRFLV